MLSLIKENFATVKSDVANVDFTGKWTNQMKSIMTIESVEDGLIKGKYKTTKGKPEDHEEFPLTGFASGDLISFSVNFGKYGSITSWSGQVEGEGNAETIKTLWHLATNVKEGMEEENLWAAILSGADNFTRIR